jgi:hypothetical protein
MQRERNRQRQTGHREEMRDIKLALHMVKSSEARDIKNASL